jgi:hypothetical protein
VKARRKKTLGRPRRRWVDNIKKVLGDIWGGVELIGLAHGKGRWKDLVNAVMNVGVP